MTKKYNYYDTPYNDPESTKYRGWETAILIFGIGVVSTLLMLLHFLGNADPSQSAIESASSPDVVILESASSANIPSCEPVNMIHVQDRDRLIQLLALASELPIEQVLVNEMGTLCYDEQAQPVYDVTTDIMVTIGFTPATYQTDYKTLGGHVASLLPPMMQITPDNPRDVVIRFLVGDTYLEWSHSYHKVNIFTQGMTGESLWFWTEPDY